MWKCDTYIHIHFISQIQNPLIWLNIKYVNNTHTHYIYKQTVVRNIQCIKTHNTYHRDSINQKHRMLNP